MKLSGFILGKNILDSTAKSGQYVSEEDEGSAIQHLARTANCLSMDGWKDVHMAMMTAAFDASGHPSNTLILVVAGFLAPAKAWVEFTGQWNERLRKDGLPYYHSKELRKMLPESFQRERLEQDLVDIIFKHATRKFGFATIPKTLTDNISEEARKKWNVCGYSIAGNQSAIHADQWIAKNMDKAQLEYVFEDGDIGKGMLIYLMKKGGLPEPSFRSARKKKVSKSGIISPPFVPLQASDMLASEYFRVSTRRAAFQSGIAPNADIPETAAYWRLDKLVLSRNL